MYIFNVSSKLLELCAKKEFVRFAIHQFKVSPYPKCNNFLRTHNHFNFSLPINHCSRNFLTSPCRYVSQQPKFQGGDRNKSTIYYVLALGIFVGGFSYAAVPLYRLFCQSYSYGGTTAAGHNAEGLENVKPNPERVLRIRFNADTSSNLTWNFKPQQTELKVALGETALAFYTATNPTNQPIDGVSTYNVIPFDAGQYFNKIQCFCFEEQRLNPHEQVDMPVFFYIDPDFGEDPKMENVESITLSYTFFEAKEGINLVKPAYAK